MDLEHLNRTQIVLLTLLTSFVTSIATGIVTVSLMNQAPPQVAATVNHIIEHTIEKVAPATSASQSATVVKTIVEQEDLAPQAIAAIQGSIIRVVAASAPDTLVSRGLIIDSKGVALTDRRSIDPSKTYAAILPDGTTVPVVVRPVASTSAVVLLDLKLGTTTKPALQPATFADPTKLQLGESVIRVGGVGADTVSLGLISALPQGSSDAAAKMLQASVSSQTPGALLIDLTGSVIGISTLDSQDVGPDFWSIPQIFKAGAEAAAASSTAAQTH